jgi:aryl-alcohol dehydrogenase-like predicted oxidoreductase
MRTKRLGQSDLEVSVLGLGCNNFGMTLDFEGSRAVIEAALDAGINFFDTADMYGETQSESFLGEVLKGRRDQVVLATKFGGLAMMSGGKAWGTRDAIVACLEASLKRLGTDYVDLYQIHYVDPETPLDETLRALEDLVGAGKVRAIGCSNVNVAYLEEAEAASAGIRFASVQNEWSLLNREVEAELVPACAQRGIGFIPYFPLASGVLTGKYKLGEDFDAGSRLAKLDYFGHFGSEENLRRVQELERFATGQGRSLLALALSWLASQPVVGSVIAGATRPEQIRQNAEAIAWELDAEALAAVDAV